MAELTKGPGYDWTIIYQFEDEPTERMSVFGQIKMEDALKEARYSLESSSLLGIDNVGRYSIYAAIRMDFSTEDFSDYN